MTVGTWLNLTQLNILGVKENHIIFIVLLITLGVVYFIVTPVMRWVIALQSSKILSYVMSSFLLLIFVFSVAMTRESLEFSLSHLLKVSLQCFSIFGVLLILHSIYMKFIKKQS
ncbi:hypothetical protein [Virgibacillus kimchii]